ncbi:hypothetical protein ABBQ38_014132 [Trebouxia sp. C0009 RCD-2024]
MGVRGCRGLRQALGVAGVRALDRLLQVRMVDSLQRLSAALSTATTEMQSLDVVQAAAHPASQPGAALPPTPDPAAFNDAVRSGGKLWPLLCHYLAPLGQACLLRQRLASDLRTTERLLVPGKASSSMSCHATSSETASSSPPHQDSSHQHPRLGVHERTQAANIAGLSSESTTMPLAPASCEGCAIQPSAAASQLLGTSSQPVTAASQEPDAPTFVLPTTPSQQAAPSSQPVPIASQLPNASLHPAAASYQQSLAASQASPCGVGANLPQPPDQSMHSDALQASRHEGGVMLLCILSLMPRSYPLSSAFVAIRIDTTQALGTKK